MNVISLVLIQAMVKNLNSSATPACDQAFIFYLSIHDSTVVCCPLLLIGSIHVQRQLFSLLGNRKNTVFHLQITFLQVQFTMLIDNKSLILKVTKYGCVRYFHILAQCKDIGTVRYTVPVRYKNNISKF